MMLLDVMIDWKPISLFQRMQRKINGDKVYYSSPFRAKMSALTISQGRRDLAGCAMGSGGWARRPIVKRNVKALVISGRKTQTARPICTRTKQLNEYQH